MLKEYESRMIVKCEEDKENPVKVLFMILKGEKNGDLRITVTENRRKLVADVNQVIAYYHSER